MSQFAKRGLYVCAALLVLFGLARLYYRLTDDFRLSNMTYSLPFDAPWENPALNAEEHQQLAQILNQDFSYIGKGAQCYAFASADQQYVLKFFKFKHLKPNFWAACIPSIYPFKAYKANLVERKKRKLIGVFNGYDLAYRENRTASELLYLHLVPTQHLNLQANVIDKIGLVRKINLDDVVFLIQKKGETLRTRLQGLLQKNGLEEAKQAISSILNMYILEYQKGIYDRDHGVMHNTGFVGDRPFHLDVGKLSKEEAMRQVEVYRKDLEHVIWKIDTWVKRAYPHHYPSLSAFLAQEYGRWTGGESFDIQTIDPKRFQKRRL